MSNDENRVNGPREAPVPTVLAEEMEKLLEDDQALVNEFVRNTLWRRYKYVLKSVNVSSHEGMIFKQFYRNCHHRLAKGRLVTKEDRLSYAKRLWDKVSRRTGSAGKKNIERKPVVTMINDCRNGVYTTMGARFDSMCHASVNEVVKTTMMSYCAFEERMAYPKGRFVFYHYFLRAAMGDDKWKDAILNGTGRFTNSQTEALAMVLLENHCESWTFNFKIKNAGTDFVTEYDGAPAVLTTSTTTRAGSSTRGGGAPTAGRVGPPQRQSIADVILGDLEIDLDTASVWLHERDEEEGLDEDNPLLVDDNLLNSVPVIVNRESNQELYEELRDARLQKEKEIRERAAKARQYSDALVQSVLDLQDKKARTAAMDKASAKLRMYTKARENVSPSSRQECRGWDNAVHSKMAQWIQLIDEEVKVRHSKHFIFELAYRKLARKMIGKKEDAIREFDIDLSLLYGDPDDVGQVEEI